MPNELKLGVDGATLVLVIGPNEYKLVADPMSIQIPGSPSDLKFRFRYKEDVVDHAIDLGTPQDALRSLQALFELPPAGGGTPVLPAGVQPFLTQWQGFMNTLKTVPFFANALATVENTNIRILEIEVRLELKKDTNNVEYYEGAFRFGLLFTPAPDRRPRLFNIEAKAFGATLNVKAAVEKDRLVRSPV